MHRKSSLLCAVTVFVALVSSCSDSQDVVIHKPGVYKGAIDPLIEKQRSPQQQERLVGRFNQVQTDR
ncbi:MAG: hypothetical protein ACJ8KA_05975 [Sulfurifustis sp.]